MAVWPFGRLAVWPFGCVEKAMTIVMTWRSRHSVAH